MREREYNLKLVYLISILLALGLALLIGGAN